MKDVLLQALAGAPDWTELRWHRRSQVRVTVEKGEVRQAKVDTYQGVGARVLAGGAWGFSSTSTVDPAAIGRAITEAAAIARFLSSARQEKARLPQLAPARAEHLAAPADPVTAHSLEEKLELVLRTERETRAMSPAVSSATATYSEYVDEKWIVNSSGVCVHELDHKPEFGVWAVASKDDQKSFGARFVGVDGGWSDLLAKARPAEISGYAARLAVDKLSAPYPDGGVFPVVMDPEIVGLLCHEAIGHTVEADFVLSGSIAAGKVGQKVAGDLVTLCDSGASELKPLAAGSMAFDDEGTPARRAVLIENGVLRGYLHNLETAARFGVEPTGNARAWEYDNEPLIRMRNTYLEPGGGKVEELIAGIKDGYYLKGSGGGQADANAEFMFSAGETYRIRDGKVAGLCRDATLSGQAFEVLKSVDALGDDFEWAMGSGHCGKGQPAKVDGGGPSIRCRVTVAGKQE
ncbi:MAG TPA: TldD/PmbA family protein [Planctomycetota bacterium]|nr:TldD/PmbA family protein [Planctomycetota bacterium]